MRLFAATILAAIVCGVTNVSAADVFTCKVPKTCKKMLYASNSPGSGNSKFNVTSVLCEESDGQVVLYQDSSLSFAGFIGASRLFVPPKTIFLMSDGDKFVCK